MDPDVICGQETGEILIQMGDYYTSREGSLSRGALKDHMGYKIKGEERESTPRSWKPGIC